MLWTLYRVKQCKYMRNILVNSNSMCSSNAPKKTYINIVNNRKNASSIGTIIYDNNPHNDCDQDNTPWGKNCQRSTYYIELYLKINIILIIKLVLDSYLL